ncbi:type I-E CRISPR-associated protein Cas7/Cse4/CasC [uncultured Candidatus Kuenenia sp.]|jgi:CRISPR system Cascade subunit CasC|uniref:type I-E CRISPR-associated protein Cas7/Cse4/CasC n=1 Tax=uncultured Candidatus Kuenenia sp. TaxID=1048336 RepID=UPI0025D1C0BA|nr:type I-E CRISPR-associated protein Cas7/Cse4/CasC [uncultured Candidatus Kuenenia sp.]
MNQNQNQSSNPYRNVRVEFHILQSFPVTCLNRDDVGAPKTAVVGGTTRARVSSQCWKRQVRLAMRDFGVTLGTRTKLIGKLIAKACEDNGATPEQAKACGDKIEQIFIKKADDKKPKKGKATDKEVKAAEADEVDEAASSEKADTLLFLSPKEVDILAEAFKANNFNPDEVIKDKKNPVKDVEKLIGKVEQHIDALDIALFGRMVAQAAKLNVEAAASFAHAISTHKVTNEVEFFTALDDKSEEPGSAHMGSLEFNSATYYRYVSLDIGQLWQTLAGQNIPESVESFVKALFVAVPSARQTTQSGASPWEFAKVFVRTGQRLQVPFETAVKSQNGGFLEPSKKAMCDYLDKKEKLAGSLFGKNKSFDFGEEAEFNIDNLIESIKDAIAGGTKK